VDRSVDRLYEWLLKSTMRAAGITELPFIWFWPDGRRSCATVTHDVETKTGRDFCKELMDINDAFKIKTAFQVIPEERYSVPVEYLDSIRRRGFEVNIHDLNHDGHLFSKRDLFLTRVKKINEYGQKFHARGFRSAVLYRNLEWMDSLEFEYDMSVPNVAHLDPQRGGCCTVMPYFVGNLLEIPVTTTQDYSLFHILTDYSMDLWTRQITTICEAHGMVSVIIHPDYIIEPKPQDAYKRLLQYLDEMRTNNDLWIAVPGEINDWWRARMRMNLVSVAGDWRIEGDESHRATIAIAKLDGDHIEYHIKPVRHL
jgi:hypothetical protein